MLARVTTTPLKLPSFRRKTEQTKAGVGRLLERVESVQGLSTGRSSVSRWESNPETGRSSAGSALSGSVYTGRESSQYTGRSREMYTGRESEYTTGPLYSFEANPEQYFKEIDKPNHGRRT